MLVLFQRETCPDCKPVRELLTRLQVSYLNINVPKPRDERHELIRGTGSKFIPALIAYLEKRFGAPDSDADAPAEPGSAT